MTSTEALSTPGNDQVSVMPATLRQVLSPRQIGLAELCKPLNVETDIDEKVVERRPSQCSFNQLLIQTTCGALNPEVVARVVQRSEEVSSGANTLLVAPDVIL